MTWGYVNDDVTIILGVVPPPPPDHIYANPQPVLFFDTHSKILYEISFHVDSQFYNLGIPITQIPLLSKVNKWQTPPLPK